MHFSPRTLTIFRWLIFTVAIVFVWCQLSAKSDGLFFSDFSFSARPFALAVILVPVNWGLEILKWQRLTMSFCPQTPGAATKAVLMGIFFGLFTPNRLGDAMGKVAALPSANKPDGAYAFTFGSMAQGLVTLLAAMVALPLVGQWYDEPLSSVLRVLTWVVPVVFVFISVIYRRRIFPTGWLRWIFPTSIPARVSVPDLSTATAVFLFSALRYLVFAGQFGLCLLAFGLPASLFSTFLTAIALVYLFSSFIPSAILGELGVRESLALIFIAPLAGQGSEWAVMLAGFTIWCINLLLPGLVGAFLFVWRKKTEMPIHE